MPVRRDRLSRGPASQKRRLPSENAGSVAGYVQPRDAGSAEPVGDWSPTAQGAIEGALGAQQPGNLGCGCEAVADAEPFNAWQELNSADITMVQVRGTTPLKFIEKNLPDAQVLLLDNYPDVIRALAQGRGDAMLDVVDFVGEHMNKHDVAWKVLETPVDVYFCGLGVQKGNHSLRDWLNVAIFELHRDGVVDEIWKKWFGIDMLYPVGMNAYF